MVPNIEDMTDRQLLEEIAHNMRVSAQAFMQVQEAMEGNSLLRKFFGIKDNGHAKKTGTEITAGSA